jgi:hypothetical protein
MQFKAILPAVKAAPFLVTIGLDPKLLQLNVEGPVLAPLILFMIEHYIYQLLEFTDRLRISYNKNKLMMSK